MTRSGISTFAAGTEYDPIQRNIRLTVVALLVIIAIMLAGFFWKMTRPRILTDAELRQYGAVELQTPRHFSDFELTDDRGQSFGTANLVGKWTLMFFGFTRCPDICPTTLAEVARMYRELKPQEQHELQIVLISLDPERDTPEKLAQYVHYFHPDFVGATGNSYVLLKLATELNVAYSKVESDPVAGSEDYSIDHSANLVLINPNGHYHGFFRPPFREGSMRTAWRSIRDQF